MVVANPLPQGRNANFGIYAISHRLLMCHQSKKEHQLTISTPSFVRAAHGVVLLTQESQAIPWRKTLSMRTKLLRGGAGAFMLGMDMRERHISQSQVCNDRVPERRYLQQQ